MSGPYSVPYLKTNLKQSLMKSFSPFSDLLMHMYLNHMCAIFIIIIKVSLIHYIHTVETTIIIENVTISCMYFKYVMTGKLFPKENGAKLQYKFKICYYYEWAVNEVWQALFNISFTAWKKCMQFSSENAN